MTEGEALQMLEAVAADINHNFALGIDADTRRCVALHVLQAGDVQDVEATARHIVNLLLGKRTLH